MKSRQIKKYLVLYGYHTVMWLQSTPQELKTPEAQELINRFNNIARIRYSKRAFTI